jgi:phospholipid/cholesterol/gamma-HCH transport system substrate-binding protein
METANKAVVGIFVGGCLALFGVGLFLIGNSNQLFTKSFNVYADFSKITGIQDGGKVRVAGMDAGTVTRIGVPSRPEDKFRIYFRITEKLHPIVRQDSVVSIQTDGLLGNKYLLIDAGSSGSELAKNETLIPSIEPFDWGDLMDEVRNAVNQVNGILVGVREQLTTTLSQIETTVSSANRMINDSSPQLRGILLSANKIGADLSEIVNGIQQGEGTAGALFKDKELYASLKRSADQTETAINNIRDTTASARQIVSKIDESAIVPEIQQTVTQLKEIARQVKEAVEKFQPASGEGGVSESLQRTLAGANEAMSDLSDNTEALKHNFFFRSFFNKRGFFDLAALTTPEYRAPAFAKGFKKKRIGLEHAEIFDTDSKGQEALSLAGKAKLDEAMTELLAFPRNGPLMIEGYAGVGTASQQYLLARRRASQVRGYLIARFRLRPAYVGIVAMGAAPTNNSNPTTPNEGVGLVSFYK